MPVALAAFGGERDADLAALLGAAKVEDAGAHRAGAFLGRERPRGRGRLGERERGDDEERGARQSARQCTP